MSELIRLKLAFFLMKIALRLDPKFVLEACVVASAELLESVDAALAD